MSISGIIQAASVIGPEHCSACDGSGKDQESSWDECPVCHGATKENPVIRLHLEPIEPGGVAGQSVLTIVEPPKVGPEALSSLIGIRIWGGSSEIMIGEKKWADRIGYTRIKLA